MFRWEIKDATLHKLMIIKDTGKHRPEHQGPLQVLSVVDQLTEILTEHYLIENYPFVIFVSVFPLCTVRTTIFTARDIHMAISPSTED